MPDRNYFLGIDVGTSGSKAVLVDSTGGIAAKCTVEYPLSTPKPLWSEQDPLDWWNATVRVIQTVLQESAASANDIAAVGLTGQMHGLVLLDEHGQVLRPAILWNDQRTGAQCEEIHRRVGRNRVVEITGKPALTGFTAPKLLWTLEHEPAIFRAIQTLLLPKDYVRFRLTGSLQTDVADASGTSLFDVGQRRWSEELIEALDVPRAWLPEVHESPVIAANVHADAAQVTGLLEGTPIVAGAGDQAAEAIGCGIVSDDAISVTVGTSGVVFAALPSYDHSRLGPLHAYCHAIPDTWHVMGVMLSAGGSLRWYRDNIASPQSMTQTATGHNSYDMITKDLSSIPPGCEGLLFLPYLTGERTPHADPLARGAFIGLTSRHTQPHMARAVLEGVAFGLRDSLELVREAGIQFKHIRVSGGGARSPLWRQIMADVFQCEVTTVNVTEGAAFGAALLAAVGAGEFPSVSAAARAIVRDVDATSPSDAHATYNSYYQQYKELYPALAPSFQSLGALDQPS